MYLPGSSVTPVSYWIGCVIRRSALAARQRHLNPIAHVPLRRAVRILHLEEDVEGQGLRTTAPGQLELAAGNLGGHRDEILRPRHLEVVQLQRDGDVGDRVLEHQRFFELALALDAVLLLPLLVRVVPRTIRQRHLPRAVLEADLDAAELAVVRRMRAVEGEDVVAASGRRPPAGCRATGRCSPGAPCRPCLSPARRSVSCDRCSRATCCCASAPVNMPMPPGERWLALPSGAIATSPRASTGKIWTFARIAALVVARICALLSVPFTLRLSVKKTSDFCSGSGRSIATAVCSAASFRSVVKTLNSPSFWPNAELKSWKSSTPSPSASSPLARTSRTLASFTPVVGEVLLHPHGPAPIRQDRDEIRLGHLAVQVGRRAGEHALLGRVVGIRRGRRTG